MANLHLFNRHSEYEAYAEAVDYIEPHVSYCIQETPEGRRYCVQYNKRELQNLIIMPVEGTVTAMANGVSIPLESDVEPGSLITIEFTSSTSKKTFGGWTITHEDGTVENILDKPTYEFTMPADDKLLITNAVVEGLYFYPLGPKLPVQIKANGTE